MEGTYGRRLKKNDWILIGAVLGAAALIYCIFIFMWNGKAGYVEVRIDGETVETYDLSVDRVVELNGGTNTMSIRDGKADMIDAECPDKLCVHQKAISKNNESIICLPNKLVLRVVGSDEAEWDAVTN